MFHGLLSASCINVKTSVLRRWGSYDLDFFRKSGKKKVARQSDDDSDMSLSLPASSDEGLSALEYAHDMQTSRFPLRSVPPTCSSILSDRKSLCGSACAPAGN